MNTTTPTTLAELCHQHATAATRCRQIADEYEARLARVDVVTAWESDLQAKAADALALAQEKQTPEACQAALEAKNAAQNAHHIRAAVTDRIRAAAYAWLETKEHREAFAKLFEKIGEAIYDLPPTPSKEDCSSWRGSVYMYQERAARLRAGGVGVGGEVPRFRGMLKAPPAPTPSKAAPGAPLYKVERPKPREEITKEKLREKRWLMRF